MDPTAEFAQLQLDFVDQVQWRYELIRPLVLLADGTATQRAQDTHTHPDTVRRLIRRFRQQGMLGLLPNDVSGARPGRPPRVPEAVRQEIDQLKALYAGFHARELARIVFDTLGYRIDHKTAQKLWQQSPGMTQDTLPRRPSSPHPDRYQARLQGIKLYDQGGDQVSISRFFHMARTTIDRWIGRFEAEHGAGLLDTKRGPKEPPRQVWFPRMGQV
jgi:transposase